MNPSIKKILRNIGIGLIALLLLVVSAIGFVFQFVLTPEKITPKVVTALNENLNAELHLEAIELTFFKTFPSFKLELTNGYVLNEIQLVDSIGDSAPNISGMVANDTLIRFDRALVSVNPLAFLRDEIKVGKFIFENPRIYAYVSPNGDPNWNILKEKGAEKDHEGQKDPKKEFEASLDLQNIEVKNGALTFDDRYTGNYLTTSGFDLELAATYTSELIVLNLLTDTEHVVFRKQDKTFTDDIALRLTADFEVDRISRSITLEETTVGLNDIVMKASGVLLPNKAQRQVEVDLDMELEVPTMNTLIELMPEAVFDKTERYKASGQVQFKAQINGVYKKGQLPGIKANLMIQDGRLSYDDKPNQIDQLALQADFYMPSDKGVQSSFNLSEFHVVGLGTDLRAKGHGSDLFGQGQMDLDLTGSLDLDALHNTLPFKKQVQLGGKAELAIKTDFSLQNLEEKDYGSFEALGKLRIDQMHYEHPDDSTYLHLDLLELVTKQEQGSHHKTDAKGRVVGGKIDVEGFKLSRGKQFEARSDQFKVQFSSLPRKDTTSFTTANASVVARNLNLFMGDSMRTVLRNLDGDFHLSPGVNDPKTPTMKSSFRLDSLGVLLKGKKLGVLSGAYELSSSRAPDKSWLFEGHISFDKMLAFLPTFPLWLKMPETRVELLPGQIVLSKAKVEIGGSDLTATGKVYNFADAFLREQVFRGELKVHASLIDVNEMVRAMNQGAQWKQAQAEGTAEAYPQEVDKTAAASEAPPRSFVVPDKLDLRFESVFDKVLYKRHAMDKVVGLITIKDQSIALTALQMDTRAARMYTTVNYASPDQGRADLDFDFRLIEIDLSQLTDLFPIIDSLLPMADSFEGHVNYRMKGTAKLDRNLGMVTPSLDAIARVEGDDLVILDGKTFQRISKILLFKNKEKNAIDKLEFAMVFKDNYIEIFPSMITIDRYRLALGGKHKMDMTYDYHLSILKSPVPFKAGIDIIGTDDDLDLKITRAKYKRLFSTRERQRKKADSSLIIRKNEVIRRLPFYVDQ